MKKVEVEYTDTFHIEFETKEMPGAIVATEIIIRKRILREKDVARLDLREHPLYPKLERYVKDNPSGKLG